MSHETLDSARQTQARNPRGTSLRNSVAERAGGWLERTRLLEERPFAIRFWDGSTLPAQRGGPAPTVVVSAPEVLGRLLREPDEVGLGRAWIRGDIDVEGDLEPILTLALGAARPRSLTRGERVRALALVARLAGARSIRRAAAAEAEWRGVRARRHSLRRDSEAVRHHYDVPTEFYELVLGPSMVYSCAYFASPGESVDVAQERKLERICRKLRLRPGDRLLDLGCGWGSLLLHAALRHGARCVGITLSPVQAEAARARIRLAGASDLCEVRVADYREIDDGPYDAISSVGMYEHVGRDQLPTYAQAVARLLRPGGLFLNHGIARLTDRPRGDRSFIWRFVFPDGELHPVTDLLTAMQAAGLEPRDVESMREHYPLTLRAWLANLAAGRDRAVAAAGRERERIWRLYMAGSALAFERGDLSLFQVLAARPGAPHQLPLRRAELFAAH